MADANRGQLSYIKEAAWGDIPESALTDLRFNSESFSHNVATTESEEIRSDRQTTDLVQTGADSNGGYNFELSYEAPPDDLLAGALWAAAWIGVGGTTTTTITAGDGAGTTDIALAASGNTITIGSSVTHDIVAGQWIKLTGFDADDGFHFVTLVAGKVITVEALSTTATKTSVATITGSRLRNGVTEHSFTFQRQLADAVQFFAYRGQVCNEFSMSASAESIVTGSLNFTGGSVASTDIKQTSYGAGNNTAAPSNDVMNAVANVAQIREGGTTVAAGLFIQELSFSLQNNVRAIKAIGTLGNADVGVGKCQITGNLNTLFNDETLYAKFLASTGSSLSFKIADAATDALSNAYIIDFPNIKFESDDGGKIGGSNQDVSENLSWKALRHSTYDCMMQICKFTV